MRKVAGQITKKIRLRIRIEKTGEPIRKVEPETRC